MDDALTWQEQARCRGLDHEQFFQRAAARSHAAILICTRCRVREECLRYALDNEVDFGVWGGLTERQRRALARRQAG